MIRKHFIHATAIVLTIGLASQAGARAVYDGFAEAALTITSITNTTTPEDTTGLTIRADTFALEGDFTQLDGLATAVRSGESQVVATDSNNLTVGDGITQAIQIGGTTEPFGRSLAEHFSAGSVVLENLSQTDSFEVDVVFSYELGTSARKNLLDDKADAFASLAFSVEDDASDGFITGETFESTSDTQLELVGETFGDTQELTFIVSPGGLVFVDVELQVVGSAESLFPIPIPAAFPLLLGALLLLPRTARKRA